MARSGVVMLALLAFVRAAHAGPWCSAEGGTAPTEGSTLPVHPRVVVFDGDRFYAGQVKGRARQPTIEATIDGKKVPVAVTSKRIGNRVIVTVEIKSDKTGELIVKTGKDTSATWTISKEWKAPEKVTATVSRYHLDRYMEQHAWYDGAQLTLDQPALTMNVKWRRDAKDKWRSVAVPVMTATDLIAKSESTVARLGQVRCGTDTIPVSLLEAGVEIEATVLLPNNKAIAVSGLPNPLVLEKRKAGQRETGMLEE